LAELLRQLQDPDAEFVESAGEGLPLGVDWPMPRTPAVFDPKTSWKLEHEEISPEAEVPNYVSVKGREQQVLDLFREEAKSGWMVEYDDETAKKLFGERLSIAALKVVEEKEKIRIVHDGTHGVHVNHRIRVQDQARGPTAGEIKALMREKMETSSGARQFLILGDISKAHRRIKIRFSEWGYQACRVEEGCTWVNCVGTYGVASAGYWWARMAAAVIIRLGYYLLSTSGDQDLLL